MFYFVLYCSLVLSLLKLNVKHLEYMMHAVRYEFCIVLMVFLKHLYHKMSFHVLICHYKTTHAIIYTHNLNIGAIAVIDLFVHLLCYSVIYFLHFPRYFVRYICKIPFSFFPLLVKLQLMSLCVSWNSVEKTLTSMNRWTLSVSLVVLKLSEKNSQLEAEHAQSRQQLADLHSKCDSLRQQNEELVLVDSSKMPVDEHINAMAALKQYVFASWRCRSLHTCWVLFILVCFVQLSHTADTVLLFILLSITLWLMFSSSNDFCQVLIVLLWYCKQLSRIVVFACLKVKCRMRRWLVQKI